MARPVGRPGETRERALRAALELFAERGVNGTSLQMIASRVGITKAAVYHQFATKDEIVLAVVRPVLDLMAAFVEEAETEPTRAEQVKVALRGLIEMVIEHGRLVAVVHGDPVVAAVRHLDPLTRSLAARLTVLLTGPAPDVSARIAVAIVGTGLLAVGVDPALSDLDDDTRRREMLACAQRLLGPVIG